MAVIGISGSYGGLNVGDEAILTCIIQELNRAIPGAEIVVFSRDADYTRQHYPVTLAVPVRDVTREDILPVVQQLDLMILGGGGILYDDELHTFLREVKLAQQYHIPTMSYAVGAGPLKDPETRQAVRDTLSQMDCITVREIEAKRLLEEVGLEKDVLLTADPALLLQPVPFTDDMLAAEGIQVERPLVGFSIREPGGAAPGLDESQYHQLIADAADYVVRRFGADVVFVPMERDDIRHAHQVISYMLAADRAYVLKGSYQPREVLGLVQRFDLAIGMRLHFLIFAAISAVPFVALPYAGKITSLLNALELPEQTLVQEGRAGTLLADIDWLWDNRQAQRQLLDENVARLKDLAHQTVDAALQLLRPTGQDDLQPDLILQEVS